MNLHDIQEDIAAFADDPENVLIQGGTVVFQRNRITHECSLRETAEGVDVEFEGQWLPYRKFMAEELGRLSILAAAIKEKRPDIAPFIDPRAIWTDSLSQPSAEELALQKLWQECQSRTPGETKLIFLTAEAGEGKTVLLQHLARRIANEYMHQKAGFLLLHVQTEGRSFVRLEELVARDLGQLRISGVFYSGILRLIRHGLICIAIDGFDELLAEVGSAEAYSGLGAFLHQLEGTGVLIAAARSAYFEAEDYAAQSHLLTSVRDSLVSVYQMMLQKWDEPETSTYFAQYCGKGNERILEPQKLYEELVKRLGPDHPVLQRPFLVHQMAAMLASRESGAKSLADEVGPSGERVVPNVIRAFLNREVAQKWHDRNGLPYLSLDQHCRLLAAVADEMWTQDKYSLPVDIIQLVTETVTEAIGIPPNRRIQIIERVKAHALLPLTASRFRGERSFDHDQFLNYFLALRLVQLIEDNDGPGLRSFCERHSLPPVVARWAVNIPIPSWGGEQARAVVETLSRMARSEVQSTYLRQNAGLLSSQLASIPAAVRAAPLVFEFMYFEGEHWRSVELESAEFRKCTFTGIDLAGTIWRKCKLIDCQFDGLEYDDGTRLEGTTFNLGCLVLGVLKSQGAVGGSLRSYVPEECREILKRLGADFEKPILAEVRIMRPVPEKIRDALEAFFRIYSRNSGATDNLIRRKLGAREPLFKGTILPKLFKHGVIRKGTFKGRGDQHWFELNYPLDMILKAEDPDAPVAANLKQFWEQLRA